MFFDRYMPQDDYEVYLAERTAYCSWQMDRCRRAGMARAYVKAVTGDIDEARREETSANELAQISGQKPSVRKAKKAISNFKLRAGLSLFLHEG